MKKELIDTLRSRYPEQLLENELMSKHTSFRIGGPAELYIAPMAHQVADIVKLCRQLDEPFLIIGNGSNLLVGDGGISGLVIEIGKNMADIQVTGNRIVAQAGAKLSAIAQSAAKEALTGFEFASGIPGCLGGAVFMNAGAYGVEMKQVITKVRCLTKKGQEVELTGEDMEFSYRHSIVPEKEYIVMEAEIELQPGNEDEIRELMKELNTKRSDKQPLNFPSAGSTFKRPEGYFAGKLIMDAGLAGYTVGGAQVSEKHCGFVVNIENATAKDVVMLMEDVSRKVKEEFGVTLEPEVRMIGQFTE